MTGSLGGAAAPLGRLVGGVAGDALGPRVVLLADGVGFAVAAAYWLVIPSLRGFPAIADVEPGAFSA